MQKKVETGKAGKRSSETRKGGKHITHRPSCNKQTCFFRIRGYGYVAQACCRSKASSNEERLETKPHTGPHMRPTLGAKERITQNGGIQEVERADKKRHS